MNKNEILEIISNNYPISYTDIEKHLESNDAENFKLLIKTLNQLEAEYKIILDDHNKYLPFEKSNYLIGTFRLNNQGYGFVDFEKESYFIGKDYRNNALNNDTVLIKIIKDSEAEVIKVLDSYLNIVALIVDEHSNKQGKKLFLKSVVQLANQTIKTNNLKDFPVIKGSIVKAEITHKSSNNIKVNIIEIIGHISDPGNDITQILINQNIPLSFPQEVYTELKEIKDYVEDQDLENRTNHISLPTITIDGADAKDLDDAISIEKTEKGYKLYVHIADVTHYVKENSAIDLEAYHRTTSVYVVDRVVPMLPHQLSNGICSLNPKVIRLTITTQMLIDYNGDIIETSVYPSYIQTLERMTYSDVNKILAGNTILKDKYPHIVDLVNTMSECASIIRKNRTLAGSIDFDKKEAKIIVNKKGQVKDIKLQERGISEGMIEDFMVSANQAIATLTKNLNIPTIYRVHEKPKERKIDDFFSFISNMGYNLPKSQNTIHPKTFQKLLLDAKGKDNYQVISNTLLRSMSKARYDNQPLGHFGLALEDYLHFTSPIRRYPDLIVHRLLRKYHFEQNLDLIAIQNDEIKTEEIAKETSIGERRAIEAERLVEDRKKAEYMVKYLHQTVKGTISAITKFGFYVELENTIEGLVKVSSLSGYYTYDPSTYSLSNGSKIYKIGQKIECQVSYVDIESRTIEFTLMKGSRNGKNYNHKQRSQPSLLSKRKNRGRHKSARDRNKINKKR
ncbi:MAG: ribonuclease R [Erysipelotrichaceae bacterium]